MDDNFEMRSKIAEIEQGHSQDEAVAVIRTGRFSPDNPETTMSPQEEFFYRYSLSIDYEKEFSNLERFMLTMYGRAYLADPESTLAFYREVEVRSRRVGELALFANLRTESGLSAITVGYLGDTSRFTPLIRQNVQPASFDNTIGLSGLTRVSLARYQRVVLDQGREVDPLHSVVATTYRWNPYVVEHIKLHNDLSSVVERKDMRVGEKEIKEWAQAHPTWQNYVEGTVRAVQTGSTNPIAGFEVPQGITDLLGALEDFDAAVNLLRFEEDDEL